jgi:hypothetical protein
MLKMMIITRPVQRTNKKASGTTRDALLKEEKKQHHVAKADAAAWMS